MKQLEDLDKKQAFRITHFFEERVINHPNPYLLAKRLVGKQGNYWRFRVGDYRLITEIHTNVVLISVIKIGHRRHVYD